MPAGDVTAVQFLWNAWEQFFQGVDNREIWEFIEQEGELPGAYAVSGRFDITTAPFAREPLRALRDPLVRDVTAMSGVQCLKTLIGEMWIIWSIVNDPGSMQWLQCTDGEAKEHMEERFLDFIEAFKIVARFKSPKKTDSQKTFIKFKHGYLRVEGADNKNNLNRKSIRKQMRSEVWQRKYWTPGKLKEAGDRQTQFVHNSKSYTESQAGFLERNEEGQIIGDDLYLHWLSGTQETWSFACQECRKLQAYLWDYTRPDGTRAAMRWEDSERTRRTDGSWKWGELVQTVRYECIYCGEPHYDDPLVRRRMSDSSIYIVHNLDASGLHKSFTWNQLAVLNLNWFETKRGGVKNFLLASDQYKKGNQVPLMEFMQKVPCKPWDAEAYTLYVRLPTLEIVTQPPEGKFWINQDHIFMTVDVQEGHWWVLIICFSKDGEFHVLWFGKMYSWEDIREKQLEFKIRDQDVTVDCGHKQTEVWWNCVLHGHVEIIQGKKLWMCWKAMRGSDEKVFIYRPKSGKNKGRRNTLPYSWPPAMGDPCVGMRSDDPRRAQVKGHSCPVLTMAGPTVKDVAKNLRDMWQRGTRGSMAKGDWNDEFSKHMFAEAKLQNDKGEEKWRRLGKRPNHGWDCFCMAVTRGFMYRVFFELGGKPASGGEGKEQQEQEENLKPA